MKKIIILLLFIGCAIAENYAIISKGKDGKIYIDMGGKNPIEGIVIQSKVDKSYGKKSLKYFNLKTMAGVLNYLHQHNWYVVSVMPNGDILLKRTKID